MTWVTRVEIPTPFSVGTVNCYLLTGNGLTLIDPGPKSSTALDTLETELSKAGFDIQQVDRILVTHPHMDHFGLANTIVERSDATVYAHEHAVSRMTEPIDYFRREQSFFRPFLESMGMPTHEVEEVLSLPEAYTVHQEPVTEISKLEDGDVLDLGITVDSISTPGHAPGSMCFQAPEKCATFTGDHVLPDVTPNPLLTLAPGSNDRRTRSLPRYLDSLRKLEPETSMTGYGGHGDTMSDLASRIEETITHHDHRKERIAGFIQTRGRATAYELMNEMFTALPPREMFSGMSEIIGHLDLLEDENRVQTIQAGATTQYTLKA